MVSFRVWRLFAWYGGISVDTFFPLLFSVAFLTRGELFLPLVFFVVGLALMCGIVWSSSSVCGFLRGVFVRAL